MSTPKKLIPPVAHVHPLSAMIFMAQGDKDERDDAGVNGATDGKEEEEADDDDARSITP